MTTKDININLVALLRSIPELQSENEMLELIKQLHVHIISLDDDILDENIQMDICSELKTQINFSTFQVEKELLNVVGEIAERGVKMGVKMGLNENKYFNFLQISGLIQQIGSIINREISEEKKRNQTDQFSNFLTNTVQIYCFMNKGRCISDIT